MAFVFENSEWKLRSQESCWGLNDLVKERTRPLYLYDLDDVRSRVRAFHGAAEHIHYAMKANTHPRLLRLLSGAGLGADVVSLGELQKALAHGFVPQKIIFSGVGKDREELAFAVRQGLFQINVESFEELQALAELAPQAMPVDVALRLNIHLTAPTHKHIQTATEESKFGLDIRLLPEVLAWLKTRPQLRLSGLAAHIGSQILEVGVFATMSRRMGEIFREVREQGFPLKRLDLGGGLGIDYHEGGAGDLARLAEYKTAVAAHASGAELVLEPGRFLVARMGVLLSKIVYVKKGFDKTFVILNAGMNCLMRPALYQAYHRIEPLKPAGGDARVYDVVGPLCESTDIFAAGRALPPLTAGDWVGIFDAGAYGAVMANTYNESPLPEEWSVLDGVMEVL